jgi:hypothetical protein
MKVICVQKALRTPTTGSERVARSLIYEEMRKYFPYMTLQLLHSEFPYMLGKIFFSFISAPLSFRKWWPVYTLSFDSYVFAIVKKISA